MENGKKWDAMAGDYQKTFRLGVSDYSSAMISFWEESGMLKEGMRVLDVGCGVGKYGVSFARRGCDVTLVDISSEMLRHAAENMAAFQSPWRVFQCDFNTVSGNEPVFRQGFDFSISTMSPAVNDRETVQKLSRMTRGWCFLTRFTAWEQPNRDRLLIRLGLEPGPRMRNLRRDCAELIRAVSSSGYMPHVRYVDYCWCDRRTPEETADYLLQNYLAEISEPPDRAEILREAENLCGEDGRFADAVNTKVAWIYWNGEKGEKQ